MAKTYNFTDEAFRLMLRTLDKQGYQFRCGDALLPDAGTAALDSVYFHKMLGVIKDSRLKLTACPVNPVGWCVNLLDEPDHALAAFVPRQNASADTDVEDAVDLLELLPH